VYCSLDPATAILEVAVHKGFRTLNRLPFILSEGALAVPWTSVHIVEPKDVPNRLWLFPCAMSFAQQAFGHALLTNHDFVVIPSAVSRHSWNLLFDPTRAKGKYRLASQESLDLDPRLDPLHS
jgi:RES domain-containing protein